jgi:hypothetical protein
MVQVYSGLDESEMLMDPMTILEAEGRNVNANLNVHMDGQVGYIIFKQQGVPMAELYKWYENEVIHETVKAVHQAYNIFDAGNVTDDTNDGYGDLGLGVAEADAAHI